MKPADDKPKGSKVSKYGAKRAANNMMYGPGCCAHTVSAADVEKAKRRAHETGHDSPRPEVPAGE